VEEGDVTGSEARVIEVLSEVFRAKGLTPPPLAPQTIVDDGSLGLESLDFAEMVIRLEEMTGSDPFAGGEELSIHTISDIAVLYE
jgi:acyl carrier protein